VSEIQSKAATPEFRANYARIFPEKETEEPKPSAAPLSNRLLLAIADYGVAERHLGSFGPSVTEREGLPPPAAGAGNAGLVQQRALSKLYQAIRDELASRPT
jgi:hypothetical protein